MRVTQKRIDANRRNAMRSTGLRTDEGKAKVRLNALRHGLRATEDAFFATVGSAATAEIAKIADHLVRRFSVGSVLEEMLVREFAFAALRLRYGFKAEEQSQWWELAGRSEAERGRAWAFIAALTPFEVRAAREFDRTLLALVKAQESRSRAAPAFRTPILTFPHN